MECLGEVLYVLKGLILLNLNNCNIGDNGLNKLSNYIENLSNIKTLELSNNKICDKSFEELFNCLINIDTIENINLSVNNITNNGLKDIIENNQNIIKKLKKLDIKENQIDDKLILSLKRINKLIIL